jgi:hypothetical protein
MMRVDTPVLVINDTGELEVLAHDYYPECGGLFIQSNASLVPPGYKEAGETIMSLLGDFLFVSPSDKSRAFCRHHRPGPAHRKNPQLPFPALRG